MSKPHYSKASSLIRQKTANSSLKGNRRAIPSVQSSLEMYYAYRDLDRQQFIQNSQANILHKDQISEITENTQKGSFDVKTQAAKVIQNAWRKFKTQKAESKIRPNSVLEKLHWETQQLESIRKIQQQFRKWKHSKAVENRSQVSKSTIEIKTL